MVMLPHHPIYQIGILRELAEKAPHLEHHLVPLYTVREKSLWLISPKVSRLMSSTAGKKEKYVFVILGELAL